MPQEDKVLIESPHFQNANPSAAAIFARETFGGVDESIYESASKELVSITQTLEAMIRRSNERRIEEAEEDDTKEEQDEDDERLKPYLQATEPEVVPPMNINQNQSFKIKNQDIMESENYNDQGPFGIVMKASENGYLAEMDLSKSSIKLEVEAGAANDK